uniref:Uncharacterized protein n=1 Tax=Setaria italica TaxID=4555 RepID=K3Z195_SETIT
MIIIPSICAGSVVSINDLIIYRLSLSNVYIRCVYSFS